MSVTRITAYYDAAGKEENGGWLQVGTVIAPHESWAMFDPEWRAVLDADGLKKFHYTDALAGRGKEYGKWAGDEYIAERFAHLDRLAVVFNARVSYWLCCGVRVETMGRVNSEFDLESRVGGPFMLMALAARIRADEWIDAHFPPELPRVHIFEHGDSGQRPDLRLREELDFSVEPSFRPSRGYIYPLQAADLVAGQVRSLRYDIPKIDSRPAFTDERAVERIQRFAARGLFGVPGENHCLDVFTLRAMCAAYPELFPARVSPP